MKNIGKSEEVYKIVKGIPKGKVLTYGSLAKVAGIKNPRLVGSILHKNPDPQSIPCHRVVNSKGETAKTYAFGGGDAQKIKLENEGIIFQNNRLDLKLYLWRPKE